MSRPPEAFVLTPHVCHQRAAAASPPDAWFGVMLTIALATQVRCELCILARPDKATQWNLSLESLLESRVRLDLVREVGRVFNEVLGDGIDLNIVGGHFNADRLNVGELRAACSAVSRRPFHASES